MDQRMNAGIFVKIDDYKDVIDVMDLIKRKITEARASLDRINNLKNDEDAELDLWKSTLDDIERRVNSVDNLLFEPETM